MRAVPGLVAAIILALSIAPRAQSSSVSSQLDRYFRGGHETVVAELAALDNLDDVLEGLKRDAPAWIEAGGASERSRRVLAAATLALEAVHAHAFSEWKWVQKVPLNMGLRARLQAADALYWKSPPLVLEWGCALLRSEIKASPHERTWQMAAVAAAQLVGDYEFLIGSPFAERGDPSVEVDHLKHVIERFPREPRFALAQGIALEWATYPDPPKTSTRRPSRTAEAIRAFDGMTKEETIGAEAMVRLGSLRMRTGNIAGAVELFQRAEAVTRDPYVVYLARYFTGQARTKEKRTDDAERAYRKALLVIPKAQSATFALASLLYISNRQSEAATITEATLAARPTMSDPWRDYSTADHRFWPELISRLREGIVR